MPIQRTNRNLKQYISDLNELTPAKLLDLVETIKSEAVLNPILQVNVNLQFSDATITGDVPEVRSLLEQVDAEDHPQSFSISIAANTNPRKNFTLSVSYPQGMITFQGQGLTKEEAAPLLVKVQKVLPEQTNGLVGPNQELDSTTQNQEKQKEFLPGAFRPIPIPEISDRDVFVIMSFSREYRDAYFLAIEPALAEKGFRAIRVDEIQHNTTVTVEIIRQIEKSAFVVADLTGERPNVYYEVGYAHRADKEVILMAKKDSAVHFDVAAINRIDYEDYTELKDALLKRINGIIDRLGLNQE